jgi:Na+/proline symporter
MHQQDHPSEPRRAHLSTVVSALWCFAAAVVFFLGTALSTPAYEEETHAELQGKVVDSTGAVIKGAQVTVLELTTGVPTQTVTNDTGESRCRS